MNYSLCKRVATLIGTLAAFSAAEVIISEVNYNPAKEGLTDGDEYEFIELKNPGTTTVKLDGYTFKSGITYVFPAGDSIVAGGFKVLAFSKQRFEERYKFSPSGVFTGHLDNKGEKISLQDTVKARTIVSFTYNTDTPWPTAADGAGFSLVAVKTDGSLDPDKAASWRASTLVGGSPGKDDSVPATAIPAVLVNEILTHTDDPQKDAIELYNPGSQAVDVSYWYLTDDKGDPKKFQIPKGTTIAADGFLVYDADDFNKDSTTNPKAFNLAQHGDGAYLFSADSAGNLTGYCHGYDYGEINNGISFGRHITSTGKEHLVAMASLTIGAKNSLPLLSPVIISEICYKAADGGNYVAVKNITNSTCKLYDTLIPGNTWKISGIDFKFTQSLSIKAGETIYIVSDTMSIDAFRTTRKVPSDVKVFSFAGKLSPSGENIGLKKPCEPYVKDSLIIPFMDMDIVEYNDVSPWPLCGINFSLFKKDSSLYGNDPASWVSRTSSLVNTAVLYHKSNRSQTVSNFVMQKNSGAVSFTLSRDSKVNLNICNLNGKVIFSGESFMRQGHQTITVGKSGLATGMYVVRLQLSGINEPVLSGKYLLQ